MPFEFHAMRLSRPSPRSFRDDTLIPLINIVFLLLIFFMLVGQIRPPELLTVEPPISRVGEATAAEPILLLMDDTGQLALDGEVLAREALAERLAVRLGDVGDGPPPALMLKADAAVTTHQLRELLAGLRRLGVERLLLVARERAG